MKTSLVHSLAGMVVVSLVLVFGMNLLAGPASPGDLLVQAYTTLAQADHDYKGHRIAAMKQIEAAGKALGVNVKGDGKGHEPQGVSDAQLSAARGLLKQASVSLTGRPLTHVNKAIKEISIALEIK